MTKTRFRNEVWKRGGRRQVAMLLDVHPETVTRMGANPSAKACAALLSLPLAKHPPEDYRWLAKAAKAGADARWNRTPAKARAIRQAAAKLAKLKEGA